MKNVSIILLALAVGLIGCNNSISNDPEKTKLLPGTPEYEAESEKIMGTIHGEFKAYFIKDYEEWQSKYIQKDYFKYRGY